MCTLRARGRWASSSFSLSRHDDHSFALCIYSLSARNSCVLAWWPVGSEAHLPGFPGKLAFFEFFLDWDGKLKKWDGKFDLEFFPSSRRSFFAVVTSGDLLAWSTQWEVSQNWLKTVPQLAAIRSMFTQNSQYDRQAPPSASQHPFSALFPPPQAVSWTSDPPGPTQVRPPDGASGGHVASGNFPVKW